MRCVGITYNKKVSKLLKRGSVSGGAGLYKSDESVKSHLRENVSHRRPLSEDQLLQGIIDGRLFGYVQCDIEVPEHLRDFFSTFLPYSKFLL